MEFIKRNITDVFLSKIKQGRTVVLTGARQTGKTTLCEGILPQCINQTYAYISFDDPDERLRFQNSAIAILESLDTPLVILDEVQKIPALFDSLKYVIDRQKRDSSSKKKVFILTGSSQLLLLKDVKETLAGRVALLNMFPFSLSEVSEGSPVPLLTKIWKQGKLEKEDIEASNIFSPEKIRSVTAITREHQVWGGYPPVWQMKDASDKINWLKDYRKTYLERDISDVGQVANIDTFALAQKLLCARTGQLFSISEVARDLSVAVNTVKRYINLLVMSFQCYLVPPYYENIGKRFVKSPKIYFPDPGLNRVILGEISINSGASYETWVLSELLKWKHLQPVEPEVYFYRTAGGKEIDFLIAGEEMLLPIEVKYSSQISNADAGNVESFMIDYKKRAPVGLIVYSGREVVEIRKNIWAVPDWLLLGGV